MLITEIEDALQTDALPLSYDHYGEYRIRTGISGMRRLRVPITPIPQTVQTSTSSTFSALCQFWHTRFPRILSFTDSLQDHGSPQHP